MGETFMTLLKRSDKKIEEARAARIAGAVFDEQSALVAQKRACVRKLENEKEKMLDLSVANNAQIVNRIMELDASEFVSRMQNIEVELEMARVELRIANGNLQTLFADFLAPTAG